MSSPKSKPPAPEELPLSVDSPSYAQLERRRAQDARFNPPVPSPWKRLAILALIVVLFWTFYQLRPRSQPQIIYADRYSREHKYRPAASPIITERLKDGRIRIRGATL